MHMQFKMPYGTVVLNTREDALKFVKNHCNDCAHKSYDICTGNQAMLCAIIVEQVVKSFAR